MRPGHSKRWLVGLAALAAACPSAGWAAVQIDFYSHEFGKEFPHAFVVLKGHLDATGEAVDTNLGYSSLKITPAILLTSVNGGVDEGRVPAEYITRSTEHFSLTLSDDEYAAVLGVAQAWKARPQPSYNINTANCVTFVSDILLALHLRGEPRKGLMHSPRAFLDAVTKDSADLVAGHIYRPPPTVVQAAQ